MSYRCSRARLAFEQQLADSTREVATHHQFAQKAGSVGSTRLLGAYYVFVFSQLEVFVKAFVEDALSTINQSSPTFDKAPDFFLAYLLHKGEKLGASYRKFGISEDEGAILEKLAAATRKMAAWARGGPMATAIVAPDFLEKKKYPSPKNMPRLFKRLGIEDFWAIVNKTGKMNSEMILTSLNDLRTSIAHDGMVPTGFGMEDFKNRVEQMKRFVAAIDRGVSKHFCHSVVTRTQWNAAMV